MEKRQASSHYFKSLTHQLKHLGDVDSHLRRAMQSPSNDDKNSDSFMSMSHGQILFEKLDVYSKELCCKMDDAKANLKNLHNKWLTFQRQPYESEMETSRSRAKYYCQKIRESWQFLLKDKSNRSLSITEDQLHCLEKIKIDNNSKKLYNLVHNICFPAMAEMTKRLETWYAEAQVCYKESEVLLKEFTSFTKRCEELQQCLNKVREDQKISWQTVLKRIDPRGRDLPTSSFSSSHGASSQNGWVPMDLVKTIEE